MAIIVVKSRFEVLKMIICGQRKIQEKPDFTRVTEVVESCQMCWISNGIQQVCNTNINDMYRTFFRKQLLGNVLSFCHVDIKFHKHLRIYFYSLNITKKYCEMPQKHIENIEHTF